MAEQVILEMNHIHKKFPGVYALKDVSFNLKAGEVHALLGENGAGKSTLIKILGGIYKMDQGEIKINNSKVEISSAQDATEHGISIIHQELVLVPYLSVAENIFLGRETKKGIFIDKEYMVRRTRQAMDEFGISIDPNVMIADLSIADQQMVEIVKAVSFNSKIIVMDEPTSSLSDNEVEALFRNIRLLKQKRIGIIYISHRMSELGQIADRVTILRDGQYVATKDVSSTSNDELVALMVGRKLTSYYTRTYNKCTETMLEVKNLTTSSIHNVSFTLKKGEILGFSGLVGAGRSETMEAIFGLDLIKSGSIKLQGKELVGMKPNQIIHEGIGLVPEDRKLDGIFPVMPVKFNMTIKVLEQFIHGISYDKDKEDEIADEYASKLEVKGGGMDVSMNSLSGGNQQKIIIGSWLATKPKVLIMDEPTRGIDVGAKSEIYQIMNELVKNGISIIMVSSELPEVMNISDRIIVMRDGEISGVLDHTEATQEKIMQLSVTV